MSLGMTDVLTLVGRLDDAPGFDAPRERFRRFLIERITDSRLADSILEDCQRAIGEQPHRVLQDTVVLLGRFLGFETTFGTYERGPGGLKIDGQWRSRSRVHVVLEIRSDQMRATDFDGLERSVAAVSAAAQLPPGGALGLCVTARQYAGRVRLDALAAARPQPNLRVITVRSLAWLAGMVSGGPLSHEHVVRLLTSGVDLDFAVELLERMANLTKRAPAPEPAGQPVMPAEQGFWATSLTASDSTAPEQLLASVIGQRRILGVADSGPRGGALPGDWVCLCVPGRGVLGHAQLARVIERGAGVVRHSERFSRVFGLESVELYETPITTAPGIERRLASGNGRTSAGPCLAAVSREEFLAMTSWRDAPRLTAAPHLAPDGGRAATDRASR